MFKVVCKRGVRVIIIVLLICMISMSLIIHELGHVMLAKLMGFEVESVGLGIGFKLFEFKYKGIHTRINLIPCGGYSKINGMEKETNNRKESTILFLKKISVLLAGPAFNFIIVFIVFFMISVSITGIPIEQIDNTDFIYDYDIKLGDKITHVDGNFIGLKDNNKKINNTLTINQNGIRKEIQINRYMNSEGITIQSLGITLEKNPIKIRITNSIATINNLAKMYEGMFTDIFTKTDKVVENIEKSESLTSQLSGTINNNIIGGIIDGILLYIGILNSALVFINLLPIPIMDGGRIVISLIEMLIGRSINKRFISMLMWISLVLLVAFEIFFWRGI